MENKPYTQESRMPYGVYKGIKLGNVPNGYLIYIYKEGRCSERLKEYIHKYLGYKPDK